MRFAYEPDDFKQFSKARVTSAAKSSGTHTSSLNASLSGRSLGGWILFCAGAAVLFFCLKRYAPYIGSLRRAQTYSVLVLEVYLGVSIAVMCVLIALFVIIRLQFRIQFAFQSDLKEPHVATVDASGVTLAGVTSSAHWIWAGITGWMETETVFILRVSKRYFVILPKRGAFNESQLEKARSIIQTHATKLDGV